jgi:hypothetical protein
MSTTTSDNEINTVNICVKRKSVFKYRDTFFKVKDNVVDNEGDNDKDERVDAFGNPIRKGKRKHKVSFSDEVSKGKLVDVIELCKTYKSNKNYGENNNNNINTSSKRNVSVQRNERKDNQKENVKCESCVLY